MKYKDTYSRIIAGTMTWGIWGKRFSPAETADLIEACVAMGITTFDHADIYGGYTNETDFGKGLVQTAVEREAIQLISKCGIQFNSELRPNKVKHYDYSKGYIVSSVERSLKCLQTDYLDLLLLHRPSPLMHPDEIAEAITKLKGEGKIRSFGVSNFTPSQVALLETALPVDANQVEFSLTAHGVMHDGSLDDCMGSGRMAMSWSPLGTFFKESTERTERITRAMKPMIEKYNATADQLLLAWILKHPSGVYPVVGTATKARLETSIAAAQIAMDQEDWFVLLEASAGAEVP